MIPSQHPQPIPSMGNTPPPPLDQLSIDQLGNAILYTVQALQRLHASFDHKFTRSP